MILINKQEWKEEFEFEITTERELEIEVMDKEVIGEDKFMGLARVGILDWVAQGKYDGVIELFDKLNHHAGQLVSRELSLLFLVHLDVHELHSSLLSRPYQLHSTEMELTHKGHHNTLMLRILQP